ncbi:integrase/recombinase XerC [Deinobacterium chartae]|uniref:Integrase/recombinase XerC n=1 Tax=Deinobacterium chartae TaxID=521158 RepID=A0A841I5X7_9DEIO|nr:site-specific integrase [Deinobacterium chartae]MBB6099669.1 integrase/recombinase XerC [Deinobacterium chartae]
MTLDVYRGTLLSRARTLATLPEDELRRRAIAAARDHDLEGLWQLLEAYLGVHGKRRSQLSPGTLTKYRQGLRALLEIGQFDLLRPGRNDGALYLGRLETAGLASSTVGVRLAAARALYAALRWAGATQANPFDGLSPQRDPVDPADKRGAYSRLEVERMLEAADPLMRVLVLLGAHAGLRISEALALEAGDVDLARRRLTVRRGKGGRQRSVVISRSLADALYAYGVQRLPIALNADQVRYRLEVLCKRAGVNQRGRAYHGLRHHAGTRLMAETRDLDRTAHHLGHANINTTRVYAKLADNALDNTAGQW